MASIADELLGILKPPPASFFMPRETAASSRKEKRAPDERVKGGIAAHNARKAEKARASALDALSKLGRPSSAAQIGEMRGLKKPGNAMSTLNKLSGAGVLVKYKDCNQPRNPIVFWFADRARPPQEPIVRKWQPANLARNKIMGEEVRAALRAIGKPATRGDIHKVRGIVSDHRSLASIEGVVRTLGKRRGRDAWLYSLGEKCP